MNTFIEKYAKQFVAKTENDNIIRVKNFELEQECQGFQVYHADKSLRLKKLELSQELVRDFFRRVDKISVTDLEYVSFYRFFIANIMNELSGKQLSDWMKKTLHDRATGAFILSIENFTPNVKQDFEKILKIQTAISYMFGKTNLDSMSGLFYARFAVELKDHSDSYLRKFHERMTLHNDGTFVNEVTDYVLMSKLAEEDVEGGNSLLLHIDDWEDVSDFYHHPLSTQNMKFVAPPSKHVNNSVNHPIFNSDNQNRPCIAYIDQFVKPTTPDEGMYLYALSQSLETSKKTLGFELTVGSSVICNNHFWLHGRDKFMPTNNLYRELMRQRGEFFE